MKQSNWNLPWGMAKLAEIEKPKGMKSGRIPYGWSANAELYGKTRPNF